MQFINPVTVKFKLDGWWGRESAFLESTSFIAQLKFRTIEELKINNLFDNDDKDNDKRNMTAHCALAQASRHTRRAANQVKDRDVIYNAVNNQEIKLSNNNIKIGRDLIKLDFTVANIQLHVTLIFKKDIGQRMDEVTNAVSRAWNYVSSFLPSSGPLLADIGTAAGTTTSTSVLQTESKNSSESKPKQYCCICMAGPNDHVFLPCMHLCACEGCSKLVTLCPICRGPITESKKIFDGGIN